MIAALEVAIGLCFVTGRFLRVGVWLMGAQMIGAMSPLVLFPGELFSGPLHAPTLAAQYIVKDVILVAAAMVIASTWTGARIVAEPRSMRSTLLTRAPRLAGASGPGMAPPRMRGMGATPTLTGLEIEDRSTDSSKVEGTAHFRSGDGYDPENGEKGVVRHYRQKLTLEPEEAGWKVTGVGGIEEGR